jgi:hypothetical protein
MSFSVSLISQRNPNCYDYIHFVMTACFSGVITGKKSDILLFGVMLSARLRPFLGPQGMDSVFEGACEMRAASALFQMHAEIFQIWNCIA